MGDLLRNFIYKARKKGYSDDQIYSLLKSKGWPENRIKQAFQIPSWRPSLIALGIVAILIITVLTILLLSPKACDSTCFIERANECKQASLRITKNQIIIDMSTEDCIFKEKIKQFHPDEKQEIIDLFKDKEMTCPTQPGLFPRQLINGLTYTETCYGELKNSIETIELLLE